MKSKVSDLALFGGVKMFAEPQHVGRPNIGDRKRLISRIEDMLDRCWLTNNGKYVQEFEREVAVLLGAKHCIATCNGTVALEIAIRAAGLSGEVIVPSFTFVATAHALQWQAIVPVFSDIDPETHNIDPAAVMRLITPRTTGIIGVHVWGRPCDIDGLTAIAQERNLALIFDAAHAFGCSYKGKMIGNFGKAEVFSFHATKFLNAFEGGAVVTNDDALAARIRLMTNFGFAGYDNVIYIGTNAKMTEVSAAMGLTSLESFREFVDVNHLNYEEYRRQLLGLPGVHLVTYDTHEMCNYQYVALEIDQELTYVSRDQLKDILWAENVLARRYFHPGCHRMEPYRSLVPHSGALLQETERLSERVLLLPTGTSIGREDISKVCSVIRLAVSHGKEVRRRLDTGPMSNV